VIIYADPQCPICGEFERISGPVVAAAVREGRAQVEYRLRSFLGPESVRAVAALGAAQDAGRFREFYAAVFAAQPAEHSGGYRIAHLLDLGARVGLTDAAFRTAVREQTYAAWARRLDEQAARDGNTGTPEVRLDGVRLPSRVLFDPAALRAALGG
jgi:protein-disulfide isomerase